MGFWLKANGTIDSMTKIATNTPYTNPTTVIFKNMNIAITQSITVNEKIFYGIITYE